MNPHGPIAKTSRKTRALIFRAAYYFFLAGGAFGLAYAGYVIADAHTYQAVEQSKFEKCKPERRAASGD